ncbi:MAG: hypothetical protein ACK4N1_01260 [Pseudorhizobium sp.]
MLPPLGAALSASVDYQTANRQALPVPMAAGASTATSTSPLPTNLLSGGRIDILSLSGQLHLAQGLSIFAEAVGGYLKISRREGESLVDYAHRLGEALKSLTASQRAVLEQSISQLVRGVTLRMLTEILSNPLGPEAARLNAFLETAQLTGRDPAARAVVSSYRQNGAADLVTAPSSASPPGAPGTTEVAQRTVPERTGRNLVPAAAGAGPDSGGSRPIALQVQATAVTTLASPANEATTAPAPGQASQADGPEQRPDGAKPTGQPGSLSLLETTADDGAGTLSKAADAEVRGSTRPDAGLAASARSEAASARGTAMAGSGGTAVIYDAPALARMAQQRLPNEARSGLVQEVLYQTARGADPTATEGNMPAEGSPAARASASLALLEAPEDAIPINLRADGMRTATTVEGLAMAPAAAAAASIADDLLPLPQTVAEGTSQKSAAAPLAYEAAAFVAAAPMVAREGLIQAFVAYPQVQPAPKEEERDVERVSAIDEDGGNRPSHQDAQGDNEGDGQEDDQGAEDGDPSDGGEGDGAGGGADGRVDRAEDLYWRMADLA